MTDFKNVKRKKKLKDIVKDTIIIATIGSIGIGGALLISNYQNNKTKRILESYSGIEEVTLSQGENFWNYAEKYCPPGVDIRDYLAFVYERNNKKSTIDQTYQTAQPGDSLNFYKYPYKKEK